MNLPAVVAVKEAARVETVRRQVDTFVSQIERTQKNMLQQIFQTGALLIEARSILPAGAFGKMIESELSFGRQQAYKYIAIAEDIRLKDVARVRQLPSSMGTLYELTKLNDETLEHGFASGVIKPDMQRNEVKSSRAVMAGRIEPDDSLDFFPTPPWAVRALLEEVLRHLRVDPYALGSVLEPACGEGHMSGVLAEYVNDLTARDIHDYSADGRSAPGWAGVQDFLDGDIESYDWVMTNPPFGDLALQFVLRALKTARKGVAIFVPQRWLETEGRYEHLFRDMPPTVYAQFVERVNLCKGRWDPEGSTATAYCWLVWVKDMPPQPTFWIRPDRREERANANDVERFTAHPVLPVSRVVNPDSYAGLIVDYQPNFDAHDRFVWTEQAEAILRAGYAENVKKSDIVKVLGCAQGSMFGKANQLKITSKQNQGVRTDLEVAS